MKKKKQSVLACVTGQFDCDRIITAAGRIAESCGCDLRVLSVLKPMKNYQSVSKQIEYLYLVSKKNGSDMTVLFSADAAKAAAEFAKENNAAQIVIGMPNESDSEFICGFGSIAPEIPIEIVDKNNMVYSLNVCKAYS